MVGGLSWSSFAAPDSPPPAFPVVLDMVHHNPGEPRFETRYEDPTVLKEMGYNGKVYYLFDAPTIAIDWGSVDPDIFPKGSEGRRWVDEKAAFIDARHAACKAAGIGVYAMADLVLFPKTLVKKYGMEETFGDPKDPQTDKFLRLMIGQMFDRFPNFDGLVVRIGETYLQDAPFHIGHIENKWDADKTIIPLMQLLREEVCVKRGKTLVFRTWMSFDTNLGTYRRVSDAVEPHPNLVIGVKHCENDFHRGNAFSRVLGQGRHPQLIEVQCAREYEGKGAYPNYIAHGVIEGFEEHRLTMSADSLLSLRQVATNRTLFAGVWTWTRGGGWFGPFIQNELWCDLNAWVMAQWTLDPAQPEEEVFHRYASRRLGLKGEDVAKFRRLCLLSADAVVRGKSGTRREISPWWSRDDGINVPELPKDAQVRRRVLEQQAEAVKLWEEIARLARDIRFPDVKTRDYVVVSSEYGLRLYRIYQAVVELAAAGDNPEALRHWLAVYDRAWADYRALPATSDQCATLYHERSARMGPVGEGIEKFIPRMREKAAPAAAGP
jgi:hypothetical protein